VYTCKECHNERVRVWRTANPEKERANHTRSTRKAGQRPFNENKECSSYLGIHVAERVLSHVFKDVKRMPLNNRGFDFICSKGKKVDVKSACLQKNGAWKFNINHNIIADYFLCLAFDNREDLNPLHAWLIPGGKVNHLVSAVISQSTINKWDEYRLDLSKVNACCDSLRVNLK
jgi:hypothetical protein